MKIQTTKVYTLIDQAVKAGYTTISEQGGARSGKTRNTVIWLVSYLLSHPKTKLSVVRMTLPALRGSVLVDFREVLEGFGLWDERKYFNKSSLIYTMPNGSIIEFIAAEDQKTRGWTRDILYANEGNELTLLEWKQLKMRTRLFSIIDYNPSLSDDHWIVALNADPRTFHFITTYKDNPFLEQTIIDEIESYRTTNSSLWRIYGLGLQAVVEGLIFNNVTVIDTIPDWAKKKHWRGMDFGYASDPTAIVDVFFHNNTLYLDELCYSTAMLSSDIIRVLRENDGAVETISESADPRLIQEIYRGGCNVKPVVKYQGSVLAGITKMLEYPIMITKQSVNLIKEFKNYTWARDKEGRWLKQPIDAFNHCFVGDTLVATMGGSKHISEIKPMDYVLTTGGYRQVLKCHNNGEKKVFEYSLDFGKFKTILKCTPDHKVKTNQGWKEIREIKAGDKVFVVPELLNVNRELNLTEKHTSCTKGSDTTRKGIKGFISKCGSITMARSQRVLKFITKTLIVLTTKFRISNVYPKKSTLTGIMSGRQSEEEALNNLHTLSVSGRALALGIGAKKGGSGTLNMEQEWPSSFNRKNAPAGSVVKNFHQNKNLLNSVVITASRSGGENREPITKNDTVNTAENPSSPINTQEPPTVAAAALLSIHAVSSFGEANETVYDLTIEGLHEYIANGVVVHNCIDSVRYVVLMKILGGRPKPFNITKLASNAH